MIIFEELIKRLNRKPTLLDVTREELRQAHHEKLSAETAADYARSVVIYNTERIARLTQRLEQYSQTSEVV